MFNFFSFVLFFPSPFHITSQFFFHFTLIPNNPLLLVFYFLFFLFRLYIFHHIIVIPNPTASSPGLNQLCHLPELYYHSCKLYFLSHHSMSLSPTLNISPLSNLTEMLFCQLTFVFPLIKVLFLFHLL
ncbi:hypothetical protein HJG60_008997 [Phyllostomus discolor]|uniref:Uncharacterized protein n=1 Tax=Phyllostomus discolor TaxID=89673 RepID=A0A833YF24_9CHIR|nr:hypothetical protein HJG60_008997 [Phyllostomus discolor]